MSTAVTPAIAPDTSRWLTSIAHELRMRGGFPDGLDFESLVLATYDAALAVAEQTGTPLSAKSFETAIRDFLDLRFELSTEQINLETAGIAASRRGWLGVTAMLDEEQQASAEALAASQRAEAARQRRQFTEQEIARLKAEREQIATRLSACGRDLSAERKHALETVASLFAVPRPSNNQQSVYRGALTHLGDLEVLEKIVPKLRKELKAQLGDIDTKLAALTGSESP